MDRMALQEEQVSNRISEIERTFHIERKVLREEIIRNKKEASQREKHLKRERMIILPEMYHE